MKQTMNVRDKLKKQFSAPFRSNGATVTDSRGHIVCVIKTGMISMETAAEIAEFIAAQLNKD